MTTPASLRSPLSFRNPSPRLICRFAAFRIAGRVLMSLRVDLQGPLRTPIRAARRRTPWSGSRGGHSTTTTRTSSGQSGPRYVACCACDALFEEPLIPTLIPFVTATDHCAPLHHRDPSLHPSEALEGFGRAAGRARGLMLWAPWDMCGSLRSPLRACSDAGPSSVARFCMCDRARAIRSRRGRTGQHYLLM